MAVQLLRPNWVYSTKYTPFLVHALPFIILFPVTFFSLTPKHVRIATFIISFLVPNVPLSQFTETNNLYRAKQVKVISHGVIICIIVAELRYIKNQWLGLMIIL